MFLLTICFVHTTLEVLSTIYSPGRGWFLSQRESTGLEVPFKNLLTQHLMQHLFWHWEKSQECSHILVSLQSTLHHVIDPNRHTRTYHYKARNDVKVEVATESWQDFPSATQHLQTAAPYLTSHYCVHEIHIFIIGPKKDTRWHAQWVLWMCRRMIGISMLHTYLYALYIDFLSLLFTLINTTIKSNNICNFTLE